MPTPAPPQPSMSNPETPVSIRHLLESIREDLARCARKSLGGRLAALLFHPELKLLVSCRIARFLNFKRSRLARAGLVIIRHWQLTRFGSDIAASAKLGRGIRFPHPNGLVIGANAIIEEGVTLFQQVTLGSHGRGDSDRAYPHIAAGACLYAGAKVLGGVRVGAGATVGANAVVLKDVPDGCRAVGVPARILVPALASAEARAPSQC